MKKNSPLLLSFVLLSCTVFAQKAITPKSPDKGEPITKNTYLAIGTGINSNVGLLGLEIEQKVANKVAIYAGAGLGSWGYKFSGGGRYYFSGHPFGSAIGLSYSMATGVNDVPVNTEVVNTSNGAKSNMDIKVDYKSVSLINISYLRFWRMGKSSRFNLEVGYSIPMGGSGSSNYSATVPPGYKLSETSDNVFKLLQPGGLMIAIGFNFGL